VNVIANVRATVKVNAALAKIAAAAVKSNLL